MRIISYILLILLFIIGVSFAVLNATPVNFDYYFGNINIALSLLLVLGFAIGCLLGLLVGLVMYFRMRGQNYRLKNRIKLTEKELNNLRNIPLQDNR